METGSKPNPPGGKRRGGGKKTAQRVIDEDRIIKTPAPAGSRFKGYEDFMVQDLVLRPHVVRYRRERWLTPDGRTITAPLPPGISAHFGAQLRRFVLAQHHRCQVTVRRLVAQLRAIGVDVSRRQVMRRQCHGNSDAAGRCVLPSDDEQHLLSSPPVSGADHPAHRVAVFPLRPQLLRCRGSDGRAGCRCQLRDRPSLGNQVRHRLRTPAEEKATEVRQPLASR